MIISRYNYYVYVLAFMYLPSRFAAKGFYHNCFWNICNKEIIIVSPIYLLIIGGARDQIGMVRFEDDADSLEEEIDH